MLSLFEINPVVPEKKILKFIFNIILLFRHYLPLEKGMALHLNKLESPSLVEIGPVVLEKKIFKYFQYHFTFSKLSPLGEGFGPSFEQT